jgi:K+-sensing histidine kinase KdpD
LNTQQLNTTETSLIKKVNQEIKQMSDLISSLLMFASMNSGLVEEKKNLFRIDTAIFTAFENIGKSFPELILKFDIEETNFSLEYKGIEPLIIIAFENLFKNAALYSSDRVIKVLIAQKSENTIDIEFKNTGEQMNQDDEKSIFDSFKRGSNSKNTLGSGLGLRIVKQIIELHNSEISYSYSEEKFHLFSIKLRSYINEPLRLS